MTYSTILTGGLVHSLSIIALYMSMQDGMILAPLRRIMERFLRHPFLANPVYACPICMSSFWSIIFWIVAGHRPSVSLAFVILVTAGITTLIAKPLEDIIFNYHRHRTNG